MSERDAPYPAWIYRQSAALTYRVTDTGAEVLLVTSRGGKHWLLPKGIVEPGMTAADSACKEAREEAGVEGDVSREPLGEYRYRKHGGDCVVQVHPMRVAREFDDWPESGDRQRRWLALDKAARRVANDGLRAVIQRLPAMLAAPLPPMGEAMPPPRLLYLLRHAKSSWNNASLDDQLRPLSPRGERACATLRRYITLADIHPGLVLCSSALRTRQTFEAVRPALGAEQPVRFEPSLYLADTPVMLQHLRGCDDAMRSVMLIGHNPGMHELALRLVGGGEAGERARLEDRYPTGALAIFVYRGARWADLDDAGCELHSHVWPREIGEDRDFHQA